MRPPAAAAEAACTAASSGPRTPDHLTTIPASRAATTNPRYTASRGSSAVIPLSRSRAIRCPV